MNLLETRNAIGQLKGNWPSPPMDNDEQVALAHTLTETSFAAFEIVLGEMLGQGRAFRPAPAELRQSLRSLVRRQGVQDSHPRKVPASEEDQEAYSYQSDRIASAYYAKRSFPFVERVLAGSSPMHAARVAGSLAERLAEIVKRPPVEHDPAF